MRKKRFSLNFATFYMFALVLLAVILRLILMSFNWPIANADEATIDLMARHIAYLGEHPIFFYGQDHMGSIQAYLGAGLIRLFGMSIFSVRLGTLLIFALYIVCMYYLVHMLYTQAFALITIVFLSTGSDRMVSVPLMANGGYGETMLFGALIFLLAAWLALTSVRQLTQRDRLVRILVYSGLGCTMGLALWSDQLILPAIFTAGVLLLVCCRQDVRRWATRTAFVIGFLIGAIPLIIYNITAAPGKDSLHVLVGSVFSSTPRVIPLTQEMIEALLISMPVATGIPFTSGVHAVCGTVEPYSHPLNSFAELFPRSNPWLCLAYRGGWSLGIIVLWSIAVASAVMLIKRQRERWQSVLLSERTLAERQEQIRRYAQLMLLGSAALWFLLFMFSSSAAITPWTSSRYLTCLLFALPAVLWPVWQGISGLKERLKFGGLRVQSVAALSVIVCVFISAAYVAGTIDIFTNIPVDQGAYNQREALIQDLLSRGATRIYSDYDTCNLLIFQSNERIICSSLDDHLQPSYNRYLPYLTIVETAAHPAFVFPVSANVANALAQKQTSRDSHYQHTVVEGYSIYYYTQ
ncbi:MAG: ArnT family glycosyltransferase [Ktedonobacteraceae bacterium]